MKKLTGKIIIGIFGLSLLLSACNRGPRDWHNFVDQYASAGATIHVNGLMRMGLNLALKSENDPDTRNMLNILKKMKGIEIHIIPASAAHFTSADIMRLTRLLDKSNYESLVSIRKGDQMVNLWAMGGKESFSDPLALIHAAGEVVMIEMKGTLTTDDIRTLAHAGQKYADQ